MGQSNKAYYLKNLDLAILFSLKGMKELYGIKMNRIQNPNRAMIYQTLFALEKDRIIFAGSCGIAIQPDLNSILEDIKNAEKMLLYISVPSAYPDQCIYLGRGAVLVSAYGTMGELYRIERISLESLPERIYECGFCLKELIDESPFLDDTEIGNPILEEQAERLFEQECSMLKEKEWGTVTACLRMISLQDRQCIRQYLLLNDKIQDYISVTDDYETRLYIYTEKRVLDILANDLLQEEKL